jgi:hypothetical protein
MARGLLAAWATCWLCACGYDWNVPPVPTDAGHVGFDGASLGFCASQPAHQLCADFDEDAYNAQFASLSLLTPGALLGADTKSWISPPKSLLSQLPQAKTNTDSAGMGQVFNGRASMVTYAFDMRAEAWVSGQAAAFATILIDDGLPKQHALDLFFGPRGANVQESFYGPDGGSEFLGQVLSQGLQLNSWTHVVITLVLVPKPTCSVTLEVDGDAGGSSLTTVLSDAPLDPSWAAGTPAVVVGVTYASSQAADAGPSWVARYDNVTVDLQ